jgi:hypothetical protein
MVVAASAPERRGATNEIAISATAVHTNLATDPVAEQMQLRRADR